MGNSEEGCVEFGSERLRSLFLGLAQEYRKNQRELFRHMREDRARKWLSAKDEFPDSRYASSKSMVLVTSPILQYVTPITFGFHNWDSGWEILLGGKIIPHEVSHWRFLPPTPTDAPEYETVKEQVEMLRKRMKGE
jgi:hypothetical protein